jgi:hypothetical protein
MNVKSKRATPRVRTLLLLFALVAAPLLRASLTTASLTGRVTSGGATLAGVSVTATSARGTTRTTRTSSDGTFWLEALEPGSWDVTFAKAGHQSLTRPAILQSGRVARADAALEVSADEESVTSTAPSTGAAETLPVTTHAGDHFLDRLPLRRDPRSASAVMPGAHADTPVYVDGTLFEPLLLGLDAFESMTLYRAATPLWPGAIGPGTIAARTRAGTNAFSASLRDTVTSGRWHEGVPDDEGVEHRLDLTAGGRIVRDRLWFFASGWRGDETGLLSEVEGVEAKLTALPTQSQFAEATWIDAESSTSEASLVSLFWSEQRGEHLTLSAAGTRSRTFGSESATLRASATVAMPQRKGLHVLRAGVAGGDEAGDDGISVFLGDRWSSGRITLETGARFDAATGDTRPRVVASYDLPTSEKQALFAGYAESLDARGVEARDWSAGYSLVLGTWGFVRADAIRRTQEGETFHRFELDTRYRLFDRFEAGLAWAHDTSPQAEEPEDLASAFAGIELAAGDGTLGFNLFHRWDAEGAEERLASSHRTDAAVRYSRPIGNGIVTLGCDTVNVLQRRVLEASFSRSFRLWIRVRR